jgi:hypothetical protein
LGSIIYISTISIGFICLVYWIMYWGRNHPATV